MKASTTGRMIGPLVGYDRLPDTAMLVDAKVTSRGTLELYDGHEQVPGFAERWYVVSGPHVGAGTEQMCRKVYDATN